MFIPILAITTHVSKALQSYRLQTAIETALLLIQKQIKRTFILRSYLYCSTAHYKEYKKCREIIEKNTLTEQE